MSNENWSGFPKRNDQTGDVELTVNLKSTVSVSAMDLASLFWCMDADQMAEFFNILSCQEKLCFQLQYVTESKLLSADGRAVMRTIGEYAE